MQPPNREKREPVGNQLLAKPHYATHGAAGWSRWTCIGGRETANVRMGKIGRVRESGMNIMKRERDVDGGLERKRGGFRPVAGVQDIRPCIRSPFSTRLGRQDTTAACHGLGPTQSGWGG